MCEGVCDPGSIKRPAGTGRVQRDSGQRGSLRQRRWFLSAIPPGLTVSAPWPGPSTLARDKRPWVFGGNHRKSSNSGSDCGGHQPEARTALIYQARLAQGSAVCTEWPRDHSGREALWCLSRGWPTSTTHSGQFRCNGPPRAIAYNSVSVCLSFSPCVCVCVGGGGWFFQTRFLFVILTVLELTL